MAAEEPIEYQHLIIAHKKTPYPGTFCQSQFSHKFINLFLMLVIIKFILVIVKNKLTDLWGG